MSAVRRIVDAPAASVWRVLADGWLYPLFVVGASRMRDVDADWPAAGSRLHHSVGSWPALLNDHTEVLECTPRRHLALSAHGWPVGRARVEIDLLTPTTGAGLTEVVIREDAEAGPGRLVPRPLRQPPIAWRNTETLRRLAFLAERREPEAAGGGTPGYGPEA